MGNQAGQRLRSWYGGQWHGGSRGKGEIRLRVSVNMPREAFLRGNEELHKRLSDWRSCWPNIVPLLVLGTRQVVGSRGGALGKVWAPLSKTYDNRKRNDGMGSALLKRTGAMLAQATSSAGVLQMHKRRMFFGTDKPWAAANMFGRRFVPKGHKVVNRSTMARRVLTGKAYRLDFTGTTKREGRWFIGWTPWLKQSVIDRMNEHVEAIRDAYVDRVNREVGNVQ